MKRLLLTISVWALGSSAAVLDLGKTEVKGKVRGPDLNVIESGQVSQTTLSRVAISQLEELERKYLKQKFEKENTSNDSAIQK